MVWLWFEDIISNKEYEESIKLALEDRKIAVHKSLVDTNSITFFNDGPDGRIKIREWWAVQCGIYHLVR